MEENNAKQQSWSWLGLFFGPYYYAGYGKFKKAVLLGFLNIIPIVGYIGIPIYCGLMTCLQKIEPFLELDYNVLTLGGFNEKTVYRRADCQYFERGGCSRYAS